MESNVGNVSSAVNVLRSGLRPLSADERRALLDEREELQRLLRDMRSGFTSRVHHLTCSCDICERYRRLLP